MNRLIIVISIIFLIFTSCSSPKKDGEKQAGEECEMWDNYVNNTIMAYTNFVKEFGNKNYQSRVQAREELDRLIDNVEDHLASQLAELDSKYSALLEKYGNDSDKLEAMSTAYNNIIDAYTMDTIQFSGLRDQAYSKILTIIPHTPNTEKLHQDLIGKKIRALPGGYLNDNWTWVIEPGEIKNLQIVNVEDIDQNHKEFLVNMTLQSDGATYNTSGKVYYVLFDRDDWEIDMLEPTVVEIVRTGRYNSSITTDFYKQIIGERISIHNNSDVALLVGFRTLDDYGNYKKHSLIVGGGETVSYTDFGLKDFIIDFVERP